MMPLPTLIEELEARYPVVIVGADLSGAVVASRLARAGQRVCVLERRADLAPADGAEAPFDPEPGYFENARLPAALRVDVETRIAEGIARAREMLGGKPGSAARLAEAYLEDAIAHGAEVFVGTDVKSVARAGDHWLVTFDLPGTGRDRFDAPALFLLAELVVLAAGPWATEILTASRTLGLSASAMANASTAVMGEDAATGVVNHRGQVFAAETGTDVHGSLLVVGSAPLPVALRPVPALALAALAERVCALVAADEGWTVLAGPPETVPAGRAPTVGLAFTESMRGFFSTRVTEPDYARGVGQGRDDGSSFVFVLTLVAEDVSVLIDAADHPAKMIGTVLAPALSRAPLMVAGGDFNLFVDQPGTPPTRRMRYRMRLSSQEGRTYYMDGFKVIRDDPGLDVWADTTTLYITLHDGASESAPVLGRGILRIFPEDFKRQLQTFQVRNATSVKQKLRAQLGFSRVFLGTLWDSYVGAEHLLPAMRKRGGWLRVKAALAAKTLGVLVAGGLALFPWRPGVLRQEPSIAAEARAGDPALPADVAALGLFPQYLRGLDLRPGAYRMERLRYRAAWRDDNIVTDHGALADLPVRPPDIRKLTDLALRRGYMNLARVRDEGGAVVGIGSQVETVAFDSRPQRHLINAHTTWSILLPGRGLLFLSQKEGGADIGETSAQAKKEGKTWTGRKRFNHTLGPLPGGRGIVHGGTGEFAGVVGVFKEWNSLFEVPPQGIIGGETEWEITLLRAPRRAEPPPARSFDDPGPPEEVAALRLPPATLERLDPRRRWRVVQRSLELFPGEDAIYRTRGGATTGAVIPASLGALGESTLAPVTASMARLRDERGDVVGQAGAMRIEGPAEGETGPAEGETGPAWRAQWTLLFPGEGSVFVALDEADARARKIPAPAGEGGFLGAARGVILGGTGIYARVGGVLEEAWQEGEGVARLRLTLVTDR